MNTKMATEAAMRQLVQDVIGGLPRPQSKVDRDISGTHPVLEII